MTGPTGSGKTSTLYSAISRLNTPAVNIMTAEESGRVQPSPASTRCRCERARASPSALALRSFLRQDPNVILVGEIRDLETAEIAIKAALTGHLVLSTLHTNDAAATIHRLVNMGIEPFLVARRGQSGLRAAAGAAHLHRMRRGRTRSAARARSDRVSGRTRPPGSCRAGERGASAATAAATGGGFGLYEVMAVTERFGEMVREGASTAQLGRRAIEDGMVTLRASGLRKIAAGLTSIEEVLKET